MAEIRDVTAPAKVCQHATGALPNGGWGGIEPARIEISLQRDAAGWEPPPSSSGSVCQIHSDYVCLGVVRDLLQRPG